MLSTRNGKLAAALTAVLAMTLLVCTVGRERAVAIDHITPSSSSIHLIQGNSASIAAATCCGDCDGSNSVTIDELLKGVNIALGATDLSTCLPFDPNGDRVVTIDELIQAVNNALDGCPPTSTATRTPTGVQTATATQTVTHTPLPHQLRTATFTATSTATQTETPTSTSTTTATATPTPTETRTVTPTPTPSPTITHTTTPSPRFEMDISAQLAYWPQNQDTGKWSLGFHVLVNNASHVYITGDYVIGTYDLFLCFRYCGYDVWWSSNHAECIDGANNNYHIGFQPGLPFTLRVHVVTSSGEHTYPVTISTYVTCWHESSGSHCSGSYNPPPCSPAGAQLEALEGASEAEPAAPGDGEKHAAPERHGVRRTHKDG
jgi:predicted metal-binding protein